MQRKIFPLAALTLAALAATAAAYGSLADGRPKMGAARTTSRQAFHGYYDGHQDTYLNTDVSDKAVGKG